MRVNTTITPNIIRKVLKMWNVTPDRVSLIKARGNTHWKARRGRETFVFVVHGDLIAQNLLFQRGRLSGILDFDSAHLDLRAADVACARRSRDDEVARGYLDVSPLSDAEIGCLDDLWRASVLRYALQLLDRETITGEAVSELEWCVAQLEKTRPFQR
jgi:Ser/Thr protein kinase RdoA (MazF antagonist)